MTDQRESREERIVRERAELHLRPWEYSPSQVDLRCNPHSKSEVGFATWATAQAQRREILAADKDYFWDDLYANREPKPGAVPAINEIFAGLGSRRARTTKPKGSAT